MELWTRTYKHVEKQHPIKAYALLSLRVNAGPRAPAWLTRSGTQRARDDTTRSISLLVRENIIYLTQRCHWRRAACPQGSEGERRSGPDAAAGPSRPGPLGRLATDHQLRNAIAGAVAGARCGV